MDETVNPNPKCVRCGAFKALHSVAGDQLYCPMLSTFEAPAAEPVCDDPRCGHVIRGHATRGGPPFYCPWCKRDCQSAEAKRGSGGT